MDTALATAGTAAALFAATNVDDLVVLAVLSASSRAAGRPRRWQIWAGLLGLLPLGLGLAKLATAVRGRRRGPPAAPAAVARGLPGVIALTLANGGDNIAAYTPVFATRGPGAATVTAAVFAAGVAAWCLAGWWLVAHLAIAGAVRRGGPWIVPAVYLLIGLYIFQKTGVLARAF